MEKTFTATQKYLIMSPRKIRLVTALVKKMKPVEAVEKLPFVEKRSGVEIAKVIKNALASARNAGVNDTDLVFKEIQVNEGPRLKRGRAASRGRWHPFKRRMSHIRITLAVKENKTEVKKLEESKKVEEVKQEAEKVEKTVKKVKKTTKNGTKS